jgi:hypothetical protein
LRYRPVVVDPSRDVIELNQRDEDDDDRWLDGVGT